MKLVLDHCEIFLSGSKASQKPSLQSLKNQSSGKKKSAKQYYSFIYIKKKNLKDLPIQVN